MASPDRPSRRRPAVAESATSDTRASAPQAPVPQASAPQASAPPASVERASGEVAAAAQAAEPRLAGTRLIAIDGAAGSGKTTMAAAAEAVLERRGVDTAVLHMDDLYEGWAGLEGSIERRLLEQVLQPLAAGRPGCWQQYDWCAGRFAAWHQLPPPQVLVLEGCGSGALSYASYTSLVVWLEADRETRIARGVERDGEQALDNWLDWMDLETAHFAANRTRQRADLSYRTD